VYLKNRKFLFKVEKILSEPLLFTLMPLYSFLALLLAECAIAGLALAIH
jgi:hypothetical protein